MIVIVRIIVNAVFNLIAKEIPLSLARTPAFTNVQMHVDNAEWSEKPIVNALFQTIRIYRFAKIINIGYIGRFLWRCRHANLRRVLEIIEDSAPAAVGLGRPAMTFVDDDEVKKARVKEFAESFFVIFSKKLLIQGEIYFIGRNSRPVISGIIDFMNDISQGPEVLLNRLVDKDIAVRQIEYLLFEPGFAQTIDNLKSRIGLARTRCHNEQDALLPAGNRTESTVDGDLLIIARRIRIFGHIERLFNDLDFFLGQMGLLFEPCRQHFLRRKFI